MDELKSPNQGLLTMFGGQDNGDKIIVGLFSRLTTKNQRTLHGFDSRVGYIRIITAVLWHS